MGELEALFFREIKTWLKSKSLILVSLATPIFYVLMFGVAMGAVIGYIQFGETKIPYVKFLIPGLIVIIIISDSLRSAITTYVDRTSGTFEFLLSSLTYRSTYVLSKIFASIMITLLHSMIMFAVAHMLCNFESLNFINMIIITGIISFGSITFSSLTMLISAYTKSNDTFNAIWNLLYFPLIFCSPMMYPLGILPLWLQLLAMINPLTLIINPIRGILLWGLIDSTPVDFCLLLSVIVTILFFCLRAFRRITI